MTRRRNILTERLKQFVKEKLLHPHLPVKPVELLGFGSFFREKENPHDIDLVALVKFYPIKKWSKGAKKRFVPIKSGRGSGNIQLPRFLEYLEVLEDYMIPGDSVSERLDILEKLGTEIPDDIRSWLSVYSYTSLFSYSGQSDAGRPRSITERMLKGIPNIKVMEITSTKRWLPPYRPHVMVWSLEKPDIEKNLSEFDREQLMIDEFINLGRQIDEVDYRYRERIAYLHMMWNFHGQKERTLTEWELENLRLMEDYFFDFMIDRVRSESCPYNDHELHAKRLLSSGELGKGVETIRKRVKLKKIRDSLAWYVVDCLIRCKSDGENDLNHLVLNNLPKKYVKGFGFKVLQEALLPFVADILRGYIVYSWE
jgi:hypothetical protein